MSSPVYNTAVFRRHGPFGTKHRRRWRVMLGKGSIRGGNTPPYLGAGQPTSEDDGELINDGTPAYLTPPSKAAAITPSTTPSGPMIPQSTTVAAVQSATTVSPQPATTAVVVPRS
jgi:hypothetical protein